MPPKKRATKAKKPVKEDEDDFLYGEKEQVKEKTPDTPPTPKAPSPKKVVEESSESSESDQDDDDDVEIDLGDDKKDGTNQETAAITLVNAKPSQQASEQQQKLAAKGSAGQDTATTTEKAQEIANTQRVIDINAIGMYDGKLITEVDLDEGFEDAPWRKPGADITDYFNYGFTEETWKAYLLKQKALREQFASGRVGEMVPMPSYPMPRPPPGMLVRPPVGYPPGARPPPMRPGAPMPRPPYPGYYQQPPRPPGRTYDDDRSSNAGYRDREGSPRGDSADRRRRDYTPERSRSRSPPRRRDDRRRYSRSRSRTPPKRRY